jgi:uncharacterized protein (TIGR00730 family)
MNICVYCSSSNDIAPSYFDAARALGTALAQHGWPLVYGGGSVGLMGALAEAVHAAGGKVIGIIPQALLDREVGYLEADELIVTTTMRERKRLMDERADAFVTLPGGFGTLEELLEIITLKQLHYHEKPIIIVNVNGFYDALLAQFAHIFEAGFASKRFLQISGTPNLYTVVDSVEAAVELLAQ